MLHVQEPLLAQTRLYGRVLVALRVAHLVVVVFDFLYQARLLQVDDNLLAHVHAVHAHVERALVGDGAVGVKDVDGLQVVRLAQCIVVDVVGGSHLQTARTELDIDVAVLDDWNDAAHQGHDDLVTAEPLVLGVLRVDAHGRVAHDGLGARGGHYGIVALLVLVDDVAGLLQGLKVFKVRKVLKVIFQVEEVTLLVAVDDLLGGEHGLGLGVPVHHAQAAVDESLVVEVHEHLQHALRAQFVHGEGRAVPVARGTQSAQLLQDDASVFLGPCPGMLQELLTSEVALLDALFGQTVHHLGLRGNGGMVGAGHPAGVLAVQACLAHQYVLNGIVEHVSHVQHTGHVWWRYDDGVGLSVVGLTAEEFVVQPVLVPLAFNLFGAVFGC